MIKKNLNMNSKSFLVFYILFARCVAQTTVYQSEAFLFSLPIKGGGETLVTNIIFKRENISVINLDINTIYQKGEHIEYSVTESRWYSLLENNGEFYILSLEKRGPDSIVSLKDVERISDRYVYGYIQKCVDVSFGAGTSYAVDPDTKQVRISIPINQKDHFFNKKIDYTMNGSETFSTQNSATPTIGPSPNSGREAEPSPTASPAPTIPRAAPPASAPEEASASATPTATPATSTPSPTASTTPPTAPFTAIKPTAK
jgi:hypothetical protein